jgi:hypothetical protein
MRGSCRTGNIPSTLSRRIPLHLYRARLRYASKPTSPSIHSCGRVGMCCRGTLRQPASLAGWTSPRASGPNEFRHQYLEGRFQPGRSLLVAFPTRNRGCHVLRLSGRNSFPGVKIYPSSSGGGRRPSQTAPVVRDQSSLWHRSMATRGSANRQPPMQCPDSACAGDWPVLCIPRRVSTTIAAGNPLPDASPRHRPMQPSVSLKSSRKSPPTSETGWSSCEIRTVPTCSGSAGSLTL